MLQIESIVLSSSSSSSSSDLPKSFSLLLLKKIQSEPCWSFSFFLSFLLSFFLLNLFLSYLSDLLSHPCDPFIYYQCFSRINTILHLLLLLHYDTQSNNRFSTTLRDTIKNPHETHENSMQYDYTLKSSFMFTCSFCLCIRFFLIKYINKFRRKVKDGDETKMKVFKQELRIQCAMWMRERSGTHLLAKITGDFMKLINE
ncbi:hypothetical protein ABPG72_007068 [Tetrahymena utriculariae]